jgi:hypothetical protein
MRTAKTEAGLVEMPRGGDDYFHMEYAGKK